ncbi:MAG: VOC family protein [Novosphingobium sp.]|nr:VOC family protein [Novosphingobium sp.]
MTKAKYGPIDQIGYLVGDLDASIARWIDLMGVGPWTVFRNVALDGEYKGVAGTVTMDVGLAYQGDVQIELIQATNGTPSPYRQADGAPILGVHHIAWLVNDLDDAIAKAGTDGLQLAFRASNPGTRVAYFEAPGDPGVLFEFIESEGTRDLIASGKAATRTWDGSNPVHEIDFAAA